ncbi:hypothetical protein DFH06DRAFT_159749 [Mycena polygramma]|nr:hypothetical protein DFH06DRAFT_159749 [Mycena polygramma]
MSGRNPMPILVCVGSECLRGKATGSSCPTCLAQNIGNVFSTSVSGLNSRRRRGTVSRVFAAHSTMVLRILLSGFRMRSAVQNCASFRHLMPERYQRRSGAGGLILSSHGAQCTVMQLRARTRSDKIAEMYSPRMAHSTYGGRATRTQSDVTASIHERTPCSFSGSNDTPTLRGILPPCAGGFRPRERRARACSHPQLHPAIAVRIPRSAATLVERGTPKGCSHRSRYLPIH